MINMIKEHLIKSLLNGMVVFSMSALASPDKTPVFDRDQKHPNDRRQYKVVNLKNKLTAFLISDPDANKSSAAMDVRVGSLSDPDDQFGIAHFLEHVLFLGTKKYPEVDGYQQYLNLYQGWSNAYTADEHTNYFFEVNHEGFSEALDRFAQFFVEPLFDQTYIDRERNAVHSEHQKNLKDDLWRSHRVVESLCKKGHPRTKFSTGNLDTLKNTSRDQLINFYQKYYSANQMKLVVMAPNSLDDLEKKVLNFFSDVKNFDRENLTFDPEFFAKADLPRQIFVRPIKDIKDLSLVFSFGQQEKDWAAKSGIILSHILGYEGEGSLLAYLKSKNWVTSLSSSSDNDSYASLFQIDMELTEEGIKKESEIIEAFFSYVELLKKQELPFYLYDERRIMADLQYIYREPKEGGQYVSYLASRMYLHDPLLIERREQLYDRFDPHGFKNLLDFLVPEKTQAILTHAKTPTDQTEPYYGTKYSVKKIKDSELKKWKQPKTHKELFLPKPNPFIPKNLALNSVSTKKSPQKMLDDQWGTFWFQQDDTFFLPKTVARILLLTDSVNSGPKEKTLSQLYQMAFTESYNTWNYDVSLAGLHYALSRQDRGIQLDFSGYSSGIPMLMKEVLEKLKTLTITEKTLSSLKEDLKKGIANSRKDAAYTQTFGELRYINQVSAIHKDQIYYPEKKIDVISSITLKELKAYALIMYDRLAIESVVYGSIEPKIIIDSVLNYPKTLGKEPLSREKRKTLPVYKPTPHEEIGFAQEVQTNNFAYLLSVPFGLRDFKLNAALRVGVAHLESRFYTELRTNQQLGYIVKADMDLQEKMLGMFFLVQSSETNPIDIHIRVKDFITLGLKEISQWSDKEFQTYQEAVITDLLKKDKTMSEKLGMLYSEIYLYNGIFEYRQKVADEVKKLTKKDIVDVFEKGLKDGQRTSIGMYTFKEGTTIPESLPVKKIKDKDIFKKNMETL